MGVRRGREGVHHDVITELCVLSLCDLSLCSMNYVMTDMKCHGIIQMTTTN